MINSLHVHERLKLRLIGQHGSWNVEKRRGANSRFPVEFCIQWITCRRDIPSSKFSSKKRERKINAFAVRGTRERSSSTAFFFLVIFIIEQSREKQINENTDVPRFYHFSNADVYRNVCMTKIGIEGRAKSFRVKSNNSAASCKYRVYNVKRHRGDGIRD